MISLTKKVESPKHKVHVEKNMKLTLGIGPVKENHLFSPISVNKGGPTSRNNSKLPMSLKTFPSNDQKQKNVEVKDEE